MIIYLSPIRIDAQLSASKHGDVLTINGMEFDFADLPDGATIPAGVVPCEWIVGAVERFGGELRVTLLLPHGPNPPHEVAFPAPLTIVNDGPISLPGGANVET